MPWPLYELQELILGRWVPWNSVKNGPDKRRSLCVVLPYHPSHTETFIRSHIEGLAAKVVAVHGWRPRIGKRLVLSLPRLMFHKLWRMVSGAGLERETTAAFLKVFRRYDVEAVLAEYGDNAVRVLEACRRTSVPLIVHFHGYDASVRSLLEENAGSYSRMFGQASAIIAASRAMQRKLISLGAPAEKVHYNPCGVDCNGFSGANPAKAPPLIIAVGRFAEKKAPQLTLAAFALVHRVCPAAKLRMIGDGPLLSKCQRLARELGIADAVTFMGLQEHLVVEREMRHARCFVQHSIEAPSGDSEGTPVSVIEACATGLPVVSTRHGGIPDVVVEGETGFLVEEGDVPGMAKHVLRMVQAPELAAKLGKAGRRRIEEHFSMEHSLGELWRIIESCIEGHPVKPK